MQHLSSRAGAPFAALIFGAVALGGLAGCPSGPDPGAADGGDQVDLAAPPSEVTGTAMDTYVTEAGTEQRPRDLSGADIAAFVLTGPGTFERIGGKGGADGTFRIPAVPAGTYYLKLGTTYVVTDVRALDVSATFMGRPDRARVTVNPTTLSFNVTQMSAWGAGDGIALYAANVGGAEPLADVIAQNRPAVGATALQASVNWSRAYAPYLIDGGKGDRLQVLHLSSRIGGGGVPYQFLSQSFSPPAFNLSDGGTATLTGAFQAVAQDRKLKVNWHRSRFDALRTAVSPIAQRFSQTFQLLAYPQASAYGDYGAGALLAAIYPEPAATDLDAGELTFGDPFPAGWTRMVSVGVTFVVGYQLPGAAMGGAGGAIYVLTDDAQAAGGPLQPLVGPVSSPKVNGKDAFGSLTGVGTSPALSWQAPTVGAASGYQVFLYRLYDDGGATRRTLVTTLRTTQMGLTVPPNLMDRGSVYTATVLAINRPNGDLGTKPFRRGLPEGGAAALFGTFEP
jgi:hypothetical protein